MDKVISRLLEFSKVTREPMKKRRIDPRRLAREALAELRNEYQNRDVKIVIDALPPCQGDRVLLKQAMVNLLSNALKFTRRREHAEIHLGSMQPNGERIYFVRDNGVGFDTNYANTMFQAFHRFHRSHDFEGTGIGLALVKRIIDRHGGRIWAESQTDRGATFYFTLGGASAEH